MAATSAERMSLSRHVHSRPAESADAVKATQQAARMVEAQDPEAKPTTAGPPCERIERHDTGCSAMRVAALCTAVRRRFWAILAEDVSLVVIPPPALDR